MPLVPFVPFVAIMATVTITTPSPLSAHQKEDAPATGVERSKAKRKRIVPSSVAWACSVVCVGLT